MDRSAMGMVSLQSEIATLRARAASLEREDEQETRKEAITLATQSGIADIIGAAEAIYDYLVGE